jgi:hypothetical protein
MNESIRLGFLEADGWPAPFVVDQAPRAHWLLVSRPRRVALRSKNNAWLKIADTIAGSYGFAIKNAGSGRSPVKKRSE